MILATEIISILTTILLCALWICKPEINWEPWVVVFSTISLITEIYRRYDLKSDNKNKKNKLFEWLEENALSKNLSETLPKTIEFAKSIGDKSLEKWARLELYGYYKENGFTESDIVPEYRSVVGRWADIYDNFLDVSSQPELSIVNEYRLRFGIPMLEELATKKEFQNIKDDATINILRQHLSVEVIRFCFNPLEVKSMLQNIKSRLAEKIYVK